MSLVGLLALTAWLAVAIDRFLFVPMELKAEARSHWERKGDNGKDLADFDVSGGSKSSTKALHQTVVVFVLIMTAALVAHLGVTVSSLTT